MLRAMTGFFALFVVLTASQTIWAADYECGPWAKLTDRTCVFGSYRQAWRWERDCSNSSEQCGPRNNPSYDPNTQCDSEDICLPDRNGRSINPNTDFSICTEWERQNDVECSDIEGNLVQKWIRACKRANLATSACSNRKPADYPDDDYFE